MHPGKWVMRVKRVIKLRVQPIRGRVAASAFVWDAQLHMRWILAVCEIACVTCIARRGRSLEHVVGMAGRAWKRSVGSGQCVSGDLQVIKLRVEPGIHRVATFTRRGEPR